MQPADHYEPPTDSEDSADPHSGTRLVVATFVIPLVCFAGWIAYSVASNISLPLIGWEASRRAGYATAAVAMVFTGICCWGTWNAFRRKLTTEPVNDPDDELPADWEEDYDE